MVEEFSSAFAVDKLLGAGAFGKVYLVKSREDRKEYALKVLNVASCKLTIADIRKEFEVMASMDHRNIIKIYSGFETLSPNGDVKSFAIQMQYCPNGDLKTYLVNREGKLLTAKKLTTWMADLGDAVDHIHSLKILHRDLKPDNILLTASDILKLSDFGISKIMDKCFTKTIAGTPYFFAPEILTNQGYNEKADIYSLGRVFICMATVSPIPRDVSYIPDSYDNEIYNLISRCVSSSPSRRPGAKTVKQDTRRLADSI